MVRGNLALLTVDTPRSTGGNFAPLNSHSGPGVGVIEGARVIG